jgi:5S rRNA maturation endonuclease (ribonuclease M5)/uncharacterized protein (DUF2384 family)
MPDDNDLDIELGFGIRFDRPNKNVLCAFCEADEGEHRSPSCSVNVNGYFICKSCGAKGFVVDFYAHKEGITKRQSRDRLTLRSLDHKKALNDRLSSIRASSQEFKRSSKLTTEIVEQCVDALQSETKWLQYLMNERGLEYDTIVRFDLGCDEYRITIPVYNQDGTVANIRRYLPRGQPKIVNHQIGDSRPTLFPIQVLDEVEEGKQIVICEGEFDSLVLNQVGYTAITNTGNAGVWMDAWTDFLQENYSDHEFIICFDVNDKKADYGQRMARKVARELASRGLVVRIVRLPLSIVGGDITDFFVVEKRTKEEFQSLIDQAKQIIASEITDAMIFHADDGDEETSGLDTDSTTNVTLHQASHSQYFHQPIRLRAMVAGKKVSPYLVPRKVTVRYTDGEGDDSCDEIIDHEFKPTDAALLSLIDCDEVHQKAGIKNILGVPKNAKSVSVMIVDTMNVEELYLIPSVDQQADQGPYTMRQAYYVGHGIETNKVYNFEGITLPSPRSQIATHLFNEAEPSETDIETFKLSEGQIDTMREVFTPDGDVHDKLEAIASDMAAHITKIYGRPDMHMMVDLVFHSPLQFEFDGKMLRKGWLECLILGDTRTGKGSVVEGLGQHYRAGEMVSGESVSLAGLIGGVQKLGDRWTLVWGKAVLNDRRLVTIDEATGLSTSDISKMSRIRSEGIAEITKIVSEKTTARTRLIWLANPRPAFESTRPRTLADYNYGIEAVPELIGAAEDVARFDMVLIVAQNEVASKDINKAHKAVGETGYPSDLCHSLLMWSWSRKPEHITFDDEVVKLAYNAADDLGKKFSSAVCLIQAEDVRYKLARIAAAAAARTFSSPDGIRLVVKREHMVFAYNFLHYIYSKPCCGYAQLSAALAERSTLRDPKAVVKILQQAGPQLRDLIEGLLEHRKITPSDLADFAAIDGFAAKSITSELVRERAIIKEHFYYVKKPAFKAFLEKYKEHLDSKIQRTTAAEEAS